MEDLLQRAVDFGLSLGASYVEARWQADVGFYAGLRNGELEFASSARSSGVAVRAVAGGGLGFASASRADLEGVLWAVESAVKLARAAGAVRRSPVRLSEERLARVSYEVPGFEVDVVQLLREVDSRLERGLAVRRLYGAAWTTEKLVLTSDGAFVRSRVPRIHLYAMLIAHGPGGSLQRSVEAGGTSLDSVRGFPEEAEKESRKVVALLERARAVRPGRYDVVFGPEMAGILVHESVGHPLELDRIFGREGAEAGESYVTPSSLRVKVGSEAVAVVDDPTVPGTYGFYLVDDEGVPARPKALLLGGWTHEFINNRQYAAVLGVRSNASARASAFDREPIPRMSNTYLRPGDWRPDEIIRDTREGLYVVSYTEWNINDTRYSGRYGIFEGYRIEGGELGEPVRGFIEVDTPELWGSVDAVGRDLRLFTGTCGKGNPSQGIPVTMGGPTFRARGIRVVP